MGIRRTDFEKPEGPRKEWDFDALLPHGRIVHVHPRIFAKAKSL